MSRLVVLGAGGHGSVVADAACLQNKWTDILFLDDGWPERKKNYEWPIVGELSQFLDFIDAETEFVVAIGNAQIRSLWLDNLQKRHANIATVVHPSAMISQYAQIEQGVVVFANAVVNIGAFIGAGCIINTASTIDHDVQLARCVHICPGTNLAGGVVVGDFTWIGIGSAVKQMVNIGSNVMIGAGAAVISDTPDNVTIVGVPAKIK